MIEHPTSFPFLGSRNYIHGTSVLSAFLATLDDSAPDHRATVQRIKFTRVAQANGRLLMTDGEIDTAISAAACCTFTATAGAVRWRGVFLDDGVPPLTRESPAYPITDFANEGFNAACMIAPCGRDELIRTLVEANRRSLAAGAGDPPGAKVRFGYLENWAAPPARAKGRGALKITNLLARRSPKGWLVINRLGYRLGGEPTVSLQLCFDIELPGLM